MRRANSIALLGRHEPCAACCFCHVRAFINPALMPRGSITRCSTLWFRGIRSLIPYSDSQPKGPAVADTEKKGGARYVPALADVRITVLNVAGPWSHMKHAEAPSCKVRVHSGKRLRISANGGEKPPNAIPAGVHWAPPGPRALACFAPGLEPTTHRPVYYYYR